MSLIRFKKFNLILLKYPTMIPSAIYLVVKLKYNFPTYLINLDKYRGFQFPTRTIMD